MFAAMTIKGWLITGAIAAAVVLANPMAGCLDDDADPDERLAGHFTDLCKIARGHIDKPDRGLQKLGRYLDKHAGAITGAYGELIALIERIEDDRAHDERARRARERITKPTIACQRDWERFARAVEQDPEATERLQRAGQRLSRTLEILFGARVELADLPAAIAGRLR
jgi:hypothetical protein